MERKRATTRGATPETGGVDFYSILDAADVDVDLRSLIARWSTDGETIVVQRPRSMAWS